MQYDKVNPFMLKKDKYLFFDIFHKNNEIILICPKYSNHIINIIIINNGKRLKLKKKIINKWPHIFILVYEFITNIKQNIIIVKYKNKNKKYNLFHNVTEMNKLLTLTTLMKNDYKLINIFYDYYINQGVEYFYIYYNGKINNNIKKYYDKPKIKLIEWNYQYWSHHIYKNTKTKFNHAQHGQMHHALYKYGKNCSEYMIFNDLDEYMYIPNNKLIDVISKKEYDVYGFCNYWSTTINNKIPPTFPNKFNISDKIKYSDRAKSIYDTNIVSLVNAHIGEKFNKSDVTMNNNYMLFHFYNWSGKKRNYIKNKEIKNIYIIN